MGWREYDFQSLVITKAGHIAVAGVVSNSAHALGYLLEPAVAEALDHVDSDVMTLAVSRLRMF